MFNTCIFDLDGTLINSLEDLAISSNYALKKQEFPTYAVDRYRYFVGRGITKLIEVILPESQRNPETMKKTRLLFDEYYHAHSLDHTKEYPGISPLLLKLKEKRILLAVVSNKPDRFANEIVTTLFPATFDIVYGQRDGVPRKPDPAGALEACHILKTVPEHCLYIGDSGVDMQTAVAAGMYPVGALWGFRTREELEEYGAKTLISNPQELLKLL